MMKLVLLILLGIFKEIVCVSIVDLKSEVMGSRNSLQAKQIPILPENPINSAAEAVNPCYCKDDVCSCCSKIFSNKDCMKFRWIPEEFRFEFRIMMNGTQLFKRKYSGRNPQPACINVLGFSIFKLCADFRNVHFRGRNMHICLDTFVKYNKKRYLKRFLNLMLLSVLE
jgi:hypothetical protein